MTPDQIKLFEHLNPEMSVNVFSVDEEQQNGLIVVYDSKEDTRPHYINLLLFEDQNYPIKNIMSGLRTCPAWSVTEANTRAVTSFATIAYTHSQANKPTITTVLIVEPMKPNI